MQFCLLPKGRYEDDVERNTVNQRVIPFHGPASGTTGYATSFQFQAGAKGGAEKPSKEAKRAKKTGAGQK